jgi:hypothetical protein
MVNDCARFADSLKCLENALESSFLQVRKLSFVSWKVVFS